MSPKDVIFEKQFDNSLNITKCFLLLCGIKLSKTRWNKFIEHFINKQIFYYDFIILHTVIFGEIYGVIDCIQTGKSFVELSFNLPCITISVLATVKVLYLYLNKDILVKLYYKLKKMHCEYDNENFEGLIPNSKDSVRSEYEIKMASVKMLNMVILLMCLISTIVQVMFCFVPLLLMAYGYNKTGQLVIFYPFLVKYPFFDVTTSTWWPLIYFHQVLATVVTCVKSFGNDTLFFALCSYIELHFRLLGMQFQNIVSLSSKETRRNMYMSKAITKHKELIELVNQMELIFTRSSLFHIVTASLLICLSAFIITITDEINVKFAYFTFLTMSLAQISLICYFADMLMRSSTQVSELVYKSLWYDRDRNIKKTLLLVMIRSQKACKLTAWNFVDLNLGVFTKILSTSWSYFAVLRTMYK